MLDCTIDDIDEKISDEDYNKEGGAKEMDVGAPKPKKICAVDLIMKEDGYANRDEVCCSLEKLPNLPAMLVKFFEEHIHEDDEIRLIKEGIGYFDIRNKSDEWIRIEVKAGDLIVIPAGSYHRFTLNTDQFIHAIRLFATVPAWTPINRPEANANPYRKAYIEKFGMKESSNWEM